MLSHCRKDPVIYTTSRQVEPNQRINCDKSWDFLLIEIFYSKIHKSRKVLLPNTWPQSFLILCIYTRINQGNEFSIAGRIKAFTHLIVQHNQINWFICDNIWDFFSLNNFSNNVQNFLPTRTDAAKERFWCDLFTLLLIKLKHLLSLEEWSNILQMYLPSRTAGSQNQLINLWCNTKFLFIAGIVK